MDHMFSNAIYRGRTDKGITQRELALLVHVSLGYVSRVETGEIPGPETMRELAAALDMDLQTLKEMAYHQSLGAAKERLRKRFGVRDDT